jgi:hypothetical protein
MIGRRKLMAGAAGLFSAPAVARAQGKNGVALVIGNTKYRWEAPLPNTKRDVADIAQRFEQFGLRTELLQDVGRDATIRAIEKFKGAANGANFAAFYFAGHGALYDGYTYIVPVDVDLSSPSATAQLVGLPAIIDALGGAANRLIALDNCRNNPSTDWRQRHAESYAIKFESESTVAARATAPPNSLVIFSTPPERIALDGPPGQNSPFATALLRQLSGPSIDFQSLSGRLRRDLLLTTQGHQLLWSATTYKAPFILSGPASRVPIPSAEGGPATVIELVNAYAAATQGKLPMPPGLIAWRSPSAVANGPKVGSFRFDVNGFPAILVVTAVEGRMANVILSSRLGAQGQASWKSALADATTSGLQFTAWDDGPRISFEWRDANSGTMSLVPGGGQSNSRLVSARFQRLDG